MIDTVVLLIPKTHLTHLSRSSLGIDGWDLHSTTDDYQKYVRNLTKKARDQLPYLPRLTAFKRRFGDDSNIKVEFSVPKLLFENNLDELQETDFDLVVTTLQERLRMMCLEVPRSAIINAGLSAIHFGKNIELADGYTASGIISELNKVAVRKSFDVAKTRFVNDGQSLYFHADSHQFVIYDKVADMAKSLKRAIDKDQTYYQRSLFDELEKAERPAEILRLEVRIGNRTKMKPLFKSLGIPEKPTFQEVFKSEVSQKVVLYYWQTIIKSNSKGLFLIDQTSKDILRHIYQQNPSIKPKQAIYLVGLHQLARDGNGLQELRNISNTNSKDRNWSRIAADYKAFSSTLSESLVRSWMRQIDQILQDYKPITKSAYAQETRTKQPIQLSVSMYDFD